MGEFILILGGARSGKSALAERLAAARSTDVLFVATATADDAEMAERIARHRASRPAMWRTLEAPTGIAQAVAATKPAPEIVVLDCVTLLVSNLLLQHEAAGLAAVQAAVEAEITALCALSLTEQTTWLVVSNEVGMGLVPPYPLGRAYRDLLGRANAQLAARADRAYLLVAGLPLDLKRLQAELP